MHKSQIKKILIVSSNSVGGAERIAVLYGKILEKEGYDINLLAIGWPEYKVFTLKDFIPDNWNVVHIITRYRYFIYHIWKTIRIINPDIVFSSQFCWMILLLKKLHLIRAKIVVRDYNMPHTYSANAKRSSSLLFPIANALISQTEEMKDEMVKYYHLKEESIIVINNPIDTELISDRLKDTEELAFDGTKFMACGRIQPQKDYENLLTSYSLVIKDIPCSRLYIIGREGTPEYMERIYSIIKANKLQDHVVFAGYQSNPFKFIKQADVFVLSSEYEGLPNAMMEAMYLGVPIAATRCIPYIAQVIKDGVNGCTCNIHDSEGLAQAMLATTKIKGLPKYIDFNNSRPAIVRLFNKL